MTPTSTGGVNALVVLATLLVFSLLTLLVLRYFLPLRTTPVYLLVPVFLAISLPASLLLLLPIDLASNLDAAPHTSPSTAVRLPDAVIIVAWRIVYWLCFALTWLILPILGEYLDSGERSAQARLRYSLRSNARYYAIVLACCAALLVYLFMRHGASLASVKATVVALAYWWGLALAIALMGHGLVALPRRLLRDASPRRRLQRIYARAPAAHDRLEDATHALEQLEAQLAALQRRKLGLSPQQREWVDELADESSLSSSHQTTLPPHSHSRGGAAAAGATTAAAAAAAAASSGPSIPAVITNRYLADLTRKLVRARHRRARFADGWQRLVRQAVKAQAVVDSTTAAGPRRWQQHPPPNSDGHLGSTAHTASRRRRLGRFSFPAPASFLRALSLLASLSSWWWQCYAAPALRYLAGAALALASASIVWSEVTKPFAPRLSIVNLSVLGWQRQQQQQRHHGDDGGGGSAVGLAGQLAAAAWLLYMCAAALASVGSARVWRGRALARRHTHGESACWYASQAARLAVPLAYNFLTFLPAARYRRTAFYRFLGRLLDVTALGRGFSDALPALVLLPAGATLFGVYGRLARALGLSDPDDDNQNAYGSYGYSYGDNDAATYNNNNNNNKANSVRTGDESGAAPLLLSSSSSFRGSAWLEGRALVERELGGGGGALSLSNSISVSASASASAANATATATRTAAASAAAPAAASSRTARFFLQPYRDRDDDADADADTDAATTTTTTTTDNSTTRARNSRSSSNHHHHHHHHRNVGRSRSHHHHHHHDANNNRDAGADDENNDDDDDNAENPLAEFAHRVRNTFGTLQPPRWMQQHMRSSGFGSGSGSGSGSTLLSPPDRPERPEPSEPLLAPLRFKWMTTSRPAAAAARSSSSYSAFSLPLLRGVDDDDDDDDDDYGDDDNVTGGNGGVAHGTVADSYNGGNGAAPVPASAASPSSFQKFFSFIRR